MEKTTTSSRRGRPRQFDTDQVIESAIGAFFANGLEGTTLGDVEAATGVDRSTLYNSFGGKAGLYHQATARYLEMAEVNLFGPLHGPTDLDDRTGGDADGLDAIEAFLERLRAGLTGSEVSPGCLIVNDMAAGSDPPAAARYRELLEGGLRAALERTVDKEGEQLDPATIEQRATLIGAAVIGINLVSRHTGENAQVDKLVDAALAEVKSWRAG